MNRYFLIGLFVLTACAKEDRPDPGRPMTSIFSPSPLPPAHPAPTLGPLLVIGAGQSNMSGEYSGAPFPEDANVMSVTGSRANRGYKFATLLAAHTGRKVVWLNCAVQGSSMDAWVPGGANYNACVQQAKLTGIAPSYFLFSQGETDTDNSVQVPWASSFAMLVNSLRGEWGSVAVIYTQIGQFNASPAPLNYQYIKDQQDAVVLARSAEVKTDDLVPECGGAWHYCTDMEAIIGQRMYDAGGLI